MNWTLRLGYERPPKGLHANDRVHHMVRARSAKEVRELVTVLCRVAKIPKLQRVSVQVIWVVPTKHKRDEDGPDPFCKVIYDAIGSDQGSVRPHRPGRHEGVHGQTPTGHRTPTR